MQLPEIGTQFASKYRLMEIIGQGGFATVYRAEDRSLGRLVALKILTPDGDGYQPAIVSRFEREARVLAGLRDPHTVHLYESGTSPNGLLYMVFELLDGVDLSELVGPPGAFDEAATRHVMIQVLASLREAHQAGLLHRDLKPSNIRIYNYMGDPYCAKLMDFGVARVTAGGGPALTRLGELVGTPRYMPPEQMAGAELTPASDLYSLGMVAFEMIMGTQANAMEAIASGRDIPVAASPEFSKIINRLLRREASERFPSVDALIAALDRPVAETRPAVAAPITAPPSTESSVAESQSVSNRTLVAVLSAVAVLLVLSAWVIVALVGKPESAQPPSTSLALQKMLVVPASDTKPPPADAAVPAAADAGAPADAGADVAQEQDLGPRSKGCGQKRAEGLNSLSSGWRTYIPERYDETRPYPMMLVFTGIGMTYEQTMSDLGLARFADREGVVLVVTRGLPTWFGSEPVIQSMVPETEADVCIDPTRIYALGHGVGGEGALIAACEPWLTAMATSSHRLATEEFPCKQRAIPYLHLAPLKSGHLPLEGGETCSGGHVISLETNERLWRGRNHCGSKRRKVSSYKGSTCYDWKCGTPFESCHVDGGHGWSDRQRGLDFFKCDGTPADFPYMDTIWKFFESKTLP